MSRYKNLIRDFGAYEFRITALMKDGYRIILIGKDLSMLKNRLTDPVSFWKINQGMERIQIWVAVVKSEWHNKTTQSLPDFPLRFQPLYDEWNEMLSANRDHLALTGMPSNYSWYTSRSRHT